MLLLLSVGALVVYFIFSPYEYDLLPCPIYEYGGIYCGGCGMQRALHHLLHFEIGKALSNNLLLPVWIFLGLDYTHSIFFKNRTRNPLLMKNWMPWFVFVSLGIFIILRNIPYYPFDLLAPIWE